MKPTFLAAGVTFDTKEVYEGWFSYNGDKDLHCTLVKDALPDYVKDKTIIKKHENLAQRFADIAKKFNLPVKPRLYVSSYNYPFFTASPDGAIVMGVAALKLLEPNEIDVCLAHEFAHLELKHKGKDNRHSEELAADKLAAERIGDPKPLVTSMQKIEEFHQGFRNACLRYKMLTRTGDVFANIHIAIAGNHEYHPETGQRVNILEKMEQSFSERIKNKPDSQRPGP